MNEIFASAEPDIDDIWVGDHILPPWFRSAMQVPRAEAFVAVNGHKVHYFRWGQRGKPPLLMAHGFLAHARVFAFIAPFLAEEYDIIAFDLGGMGDSEIVEGGDGQRRAADLIGLAEALDLFAGPVKPKIITHSFGSGVGLTAMEAAGSRFGGLIISDFMIMRPEKLAAHFQRGGGPPGSGKTDKPNNIYPDYPTARQRFILAPPQAVQQPFLLDYMAYHSLRQVDGPTGAGWTWKFDPRVFYRSKADEGAWASAAQRLADLPHPLAIIYGANSKLFDGDSIAYISELGGGHIPTVAIPEAEHHLMLDQPLAFVTALRAILRMMQ